MPFVGNRKSLRHGQWNQDMVKSQPPSTPAPGLSPFRGTPDLQPLGTPTVADRVAQTVVKGRLEEQVEKPCLPPNTSLSIKLELNPIRVLAGPVLDSTNEQILLDCRANPPAMTLPVEVEWSKTGG